VPRAEIPRAKLVASGWRVKSPYAVLHPFASAPEKTWPAERFVAVARQLQQSGVDPLFVAGPTDNVQQFSNFRVHRGAPISKIKSLMAAAQLFIGNDSGPAHIAAAFGVPVVVLFGPSNPVTWAPWRTEARVLTSDAGMTGISVDDVKAAADSLRKVKA
jgi:heptosyltransferase-3